MKDIKNAILNTAKKYHGVIFMTESAVAVDFLSDWGKFAVTITKDSEGFRMDVIKNGKTRNRLANATVEQIAREMESFAETYLD